MSDLNHALVGAQTEENTSVFLWKDRRHQHHRVDTMETRHLFMTLVLIWNHRMPAEAIIWASGTWRHHQYNLGPFYTQDYLKQAIGALAKELSTRQDLESAWYETLLKMQLYLLRNRLLAQFEWEEMPERAH